MTIGSVFGKQSKPFFAEFLIISFDLILWGFAKLVERYMEGFKYLF